MKITYSGRAGVIVVPALVVGVIMALDVVAGWLVDAFARAIGMPALVIDATKWVLLGALGVVVGLWWSRGGVAAQVADKAPRDAELERYHDHTAVLASALDDAIFDACKQAGVPACDGREVESSEHCSLGTVHTRTVQVAHLLADMVRDMGAGAEQAAMMVQLLGDALGEIVRPVVKAMGAMVPAHLVGEGMASASSGLTVIHEPSGNLGELSVVLTGPPLADIQPGLYRLEHPGGGTFMAAVGRCRDEPWFAPLTIHSADSMYEIVEYDWSKIAGATLIRAAS